MDISNTPTKDITKRYQNRKFNLIAALPREAKKYFFIYIYLFSLYVADGTQPSNWSPNCLRYLQSLLLNVNIQVLSPQEIVEYAAKTESREVEHLMRQCQMAKHTHHLNIPQSIVVDDAMNSVTPMREITDDEQHMMETLIR